MWWINQFLESFLGDYSSFRGDWSSFLGETEDGLSPSTTLDLLIQLTVWLVLIYVTFFSNLWSPSPISLTSVLYWYVAE